MEILSIKSENASLFLMGEICGNEEIKITNDTSCTIQKQNGSLYRFKKYNILLFNSGTDFEIIVDGSNVAPLYTVSDSGLVFYEFDFDKPGEKNINIISGGKAFLNITFDVCAESFLYKAHFNEMINRINKASELEAYDFLKAMCIKHNIKYKENIILTFESLLKMFLAQLKRCSIAEKSPKRNLFTFRRKWNMAKKAKLKRTFGALSELLEKFMPFCPELYDLKQDLETMVLQSPLSVVEASNLSENNEKLCLMNKECVLSGDYTSLTPADIDNVYGFYCYTALVNILSQNYTAIEKQVFKTVDNKYNLSIYDKRKSSFLNELNDNVITVSFETEENIPKIMVKVSHKEDDVAYGRLCVLMPFYKNKASENEVNKICRYTCENKNLYACKVYGVCLKSSANFENIIELNPYDTQNLSEWIKNVAGDGVLLEYQSYKNFAGPFTKYEFDNRNVCVAIVKTKSQFNINIKEKFYYIPVRYIENVENVEYIALYQSKALFKGESGIRYFGKVEKARLVERYKISEIPANSDELYYRFDVKEWQILKEDIKTKDFAEVCMMTSLPLLKSVKSFPELYMDSFLEYILYMADENARFTYKDALFKCDRDFVRVYFKDGQAVKFSKSAMKKGVSKTEMIINQMGDTSDKKEANK